MRIIPLILLAVLAAHAAAQTTFSWQQQHARVLPQGDLEWAPEPFAFESGDQVRWIDYDGGDDSQDGSTPATAWKRHPLDPAATGQALTDRGADTFVFKRGTTYRGTLRGRLAGTPERPIRLTSSPDWGSGEAVFSGAEAVTGWRQGAGRDDLPEADKVWVADLGFSPRNAWAVAPDGAIARIALARTPNWTITDPEDVMSEWYEWEQPQWWTDKNKTTVGDKKMHLGVDRRNLTGKSEDYVGGIVWSEWGIVMGTPFASRIESFDAAQKGIGFQGFWYNDSGKIITGNRYFLEDRPNFLDAPGEFWFDKQGQGGRLYLRLPGDASPDRVRVEAARHINLMDFEELRHVRISGLSFRFANVFWDLTARQFVHRDVESAAVRLLGSGQDVRITHCRFEHVNKAIRLKAVADTDTLDAVVVADNDIRFTDHGAIELAGSGRWGKKDPPFALFGDVKVLRNRLFEIGHRPFRSDSAHAMTINFPRTLEVAGNFLERTYGAGIFVFMGKGSEETSDVPLARGLIHHNKVVQPLLAANDWGGIETWQGGPIYVFNNLSANPGGYWNWAANRPGNARLGFAYYLDGGFKNYHFNNIAWGANNDLESKYCNRTAFYHAVPTVLNAFFNNTAYRFADGSSWSPVGGRQLYLGNVWSDISNSVFLHGKQKEDENATYDHYFLESIAYSRNVFDNVPDALGRLEGSAAGEMDLEAFRAAAAGKGLLASDVGILADAPVLADPANGDLRPAPGSPALGKGVRVFVPWALSRTVGEWHFRRNPANPASLLDEHWYMSPLVLNRDRYRDLPRHDLHGVNVTAASYVDGPLEDWTAGALRFDGRTVAEGGIALTLPAPAQEAASAPPPKTVTHTPADWLEVTTPASLTPGQQATVEVRLKNAPAGKKLLVHLHWLKSDGWGGFNTLSRATPDVRGEGPYRFTLTPEAREGLDAFSLLVALSPTVQWGDNTRNANVRLPFGTPVAPLPSRLPGPHDADGNFLVEAFFRAEPNRAGSVLLSCLGERGYELGLEAGGALVFRVKADNEAHIATPVPVADGRWHHVIAECDRDNQALRIYVDGKLAAQQAAVLRGTARSSDELRVGQGPNNAPFAGDLEFLRISLGTLADALTTIDELHAWQFDGPFLRDFTGRKPGPVGRAAGALDAP